VEDAEEPEARHLQLLLPDPPVHARRVPGGEAVVAAPRLAEILIADPPERWRALGLAVGPAGATQVGPIRLTFGAPGERGIVGLGVRDVPDGEVDGLALRAVDPADAAPPGTHQLGVEAVDHVVVSTPDFDRTLGALEAAGFELRRVRDAGPDTRQGFYVLGDAVLEVVGPRQADGDGPAAFWGLVLVVADLDAAAQRLGPLLGAPRDAVQPGRRIATVRREAGLGTAVALMTARV
jgi:hypothetical protein